MPPNPGRKRLQAALGDLPRAVPGLCQASPAWLSRNTVPLCLHSSLLPVWEFPLAQIPRAQHRDPSCSPGDLTWSLLWETEGSLLGLFSPNLSFSVFLSCTVIKTSWCPAPGPARLPELQPWHGAGGPRLPTQLCPGPTKSWSPSQVEEQDLRDISQSSAAAGEPPDPRIHSTDSFSVPGGCWGPTVRVWVLPSEDAPGGAQCPAAPVLCCPNCGFPEPWGG